MKFFFFTISLAVFCGALFLGCNSKKEHVDQLVVGTTPTYFPYEFKNEQGALDGFDIDFAKALSKELNKKLVFKELDFDGLILALKKGKIDLILSGMSITEARQTQIVMIPYQERPTKQLALAFWEEIPENISSLEALAKKPKIKIAVQIGTFQSEYLSSINTEVSKLLENNTDLLMDIKYGKVPAALFEPQVACALKTKFPEMRLLPVSLPKKNWAAGNGIGINKENLKLISEVSKAMIPLKQKGVITTLEKKWFGGEI